MKNKRLRKNSTNTNLLPQIFGDEPVSEIDIPVVVDDYNFKMKGVDLSDQLIACNCLQLLCIHCWLAMIFVDLMLSMPILMLLHHGREA